MTKPNKFIDECNALMEFCKDNFEAKERLYNIISFKEKLIPISEVKKMIDEVHKEFFGDFIVKFNCNCPLKYLKQKLNAWAKEKQ